MKRRYEGSYDISFFLPRLSPRYFPRSGQICSFILTFFHKTILIAKGARNLTGFSRRDRAVFSDLALFFLFFPFFVCTGWNVTAAFLQSRREERGPAPVLILFYFFHQVTKILFYQYSLRTPFLILQTHQPPGMAIENKRSSGIHAIPFIYLLLYTEENCSNTLSTKERRDTK